jgi:hypothetical protein
LNTPWLPSFLANFGGSGFLKSKDASPRVAPMATADVKWAAFAEAAVWWVLSSAPVLPVDVEVSLRIDWLDGRLVPTNERSLQGWRVVSGDGK